MTDEDSILVDYAEKRISLVGAFDRLVDIGFEPLKAKALIEEWHNFICEHGAIQ